MKMFRILILGFVMLAGLFAPAASIREVTWNQVAGNPTNSAAFHRVNVHLPRLFIPEKWISLEMLENREWRLTGLSN